MKPVLAACLAVLSIVVIAGCAKRGAAPPPSAAVGPVDVTGTWTGSMGMGAASAPVRLQMKQTGASVTGDIDVGGRADLSGPVEGTVQGDGLKLTLKTGYGSLGEMRVRDDQITGVVGPGPVSLRRSR